MREGGRKGGREMQSNRCPARHVNLFQSPEGFPGASATASAPAEKTTQITTQTTQRGPAAILPLAAPALFPKQSVTAAGCYGKRSGASQRLAVLSGCTLQFFYTLLFYLQKKWVSWTFQSTKHCFFFSCPHPAESNEGRHAKPT